MRLTLSKPLNQVKFRGHVYRLAQQWQPPQYSRRPRPEPEPMGGGNQAGPSEYERLKTCLLHRVPDQPGGCDLIGRTANALNQTKELLRNASLQLIHDDPAFGESFAELKRELVNLVEVAPRMVDMGAAAHEALLRENPHKG